MDNLLDSVFFGVELLLGLLIGEDMVEVGTGDFFFLKPF